MQEIESTKIDLQSLQIKQESKDSSLNNQLNHQLNNQLNQPQNIISTINSQTTSNCTRKTDQNIFQASLERQRNLLLNMEQHQLAIYPTTQLLNEPDDKVMDIQVDSNNNNMPVLISYNRQTGSLPSINELRNNQRLNLDQLLINNNDKKLNIRLNQSTNSQQQQFNQTTFTAYDNDFNRFDVICKMEDDDYSRLSHTQTSLYDNYELNQSIKMEDAFQDDKLDFKTPTLAELNLNDDDMMDNLPTVNPNSILCPSIPMPQTNKNGFLMGCNYTNNNLINLSTINNSTISTQTDSHINLSNKDLVLSNDQFSLNNQFDQLNSHNNHLNNSNNFTKNKNSKSLSTNSNKSTSYNTRTRGRQKSNSDKQSKRTNQQQQQQQQNLSQNNQVLCKLLNEKNDNLNNFPLITTNESINQTINSIASGQSQIPSTSTNLINSSNNTQFQSICITASLNLSNSNKSILTQSNTSLANLQNDILLNQLQQQSKCCLTSIIPNNNLRINNSQATRNRNSSISTEHSFSSSHDEGFISQAEDDSDEKDEDAQMIIDPKLTSKVTKTPNKAKRKRPRKDQDKETNLLNSTEQQLASSINMKKIKIENDQFKPPTSTSSGFAFTLSTVKEESIPNALLSAITTPINKTTNLIDSLTTKTTNKIKEDKINTKGRVNYKITKDKPILTDFQQQQIKIENSNNNKLIDEKVNDEESSDDEDDESFYGDFDDKDLIGATTSDDQQNKWSLNMGRSRKNSTQRYFWQYNVQSKGPKGIKLTTTISENGLEGGELNTTNSDLEPLDPVFAPSCMIEGVKHAGKARRGDGNDLTANPKKLLMIGLELKKLSKIINDLTPVAEVPQNSKSNSRKEKNKLASRACRLKKKAQHEANKIKLHGLSVEFKKLTALIGELKKLQDKVIDGKINIDTKKLTDQMDNLIKEKGNLIKVAGNTTEFVNSVLDTVSFGNINGGLDKL